MFIVDGLTSGSLNAAESMPGWWQTAPNARHTSDCVRTICNLLALLAQYEQQGLRNCRVSVRPSVRLSVRPIIDRMSE